MHEDIMKETAAKSAKSAWRKSLAEV